MTRDRHFYASCVGSQKVENAPAMLNLRIKEVMFLDGGAVGKADVYPITIENAIQLRRELTDFLNANNVPTR